MPIQNNLEHSLSQLRKSGNGHTASFVYSKPNGSLEEAWQKRRQRGERCFVVRDSASSITIQGILGSIEAARKRASKPRQLPVPPAPAASSSSSIPNSYAPSSTSTSQYRPPPPPQSVNTSFQYNNNTTETSRQPQDFDDDMDALMASLDVEEIIGDKVNTTSITPRDLSANTANQSFSTAAQVSTRSIISISDASSGPQSTRSMDSVQYVPNPGQQYSSEPSFNYDNSAGNTDAPCCPAHGLPCRVLVASTSANMGRQFYKCSLPEDQQCDFFEWADGQNSNAPSNNWQEGDGAAGSGEIKDMVQENRRKFGHQDFRRGQRDIIQNAIAGRDVFVLMPTGGGKSLCYQLPAWCCPGLAVVISPLLSLIQDQVQSLLQLGVQAVFLSGSQDYEGEQVDIIRRLRDVESHGGVKMLYITPEKLNNSTMLQNILRQLAGRKLLSRFCVDEAHCLSDWGHDFRPDYMRLDSLRREYPGVPIMALTATANEKVVNDAIRALGMRNEYRYKSSFNRTNLHYEVRKKDSKTIDHIVDYIAKHPRESGVVYCLSRKDCEKTSQKLQEKVRQRSGCGRLRIDFYHANLDIKERERRHREWSNGVVSVLCATVAFGMGIDKPDVRYVIHYSMPKSITHYYQESGRAGRDGEDAACILFYQYKDKKILENLIVKGASNPNSQTTRRQIDQLYGCVRYCEDLFQCRRTMQLEYFGEHFNREKCNGTCDNCKAGRQPDRRNLTGVAKTILKLYQQVSAQKRNGVTLNQITDLFRGMKSRNVVKFIDLARISGYGAGKTYKKHEIDRIMHRMIFDRILIERGEANREGFTTDYAFLGENASAIESGRQEFFVDFPKENVAIPAKKASRKKENKKKASSVKKTKKAVDSLDSVQENGSKSAPAPTVIVDISSDEDDDEILTRSSRNKKKAAPSVLPADSTQKLTDQIKTLATNWSEEERMLGNNTFYWNILSNSTMKSIASQVPMSVEELKSMGELGENIIAVYGERLVKVVRAFVSNHGLEDHIAKKRPVKKPRVVPEESALTSVPAGSELGTLDDEFGSSIDFSAIDEPSVPSSSKFFSKSMA